MGSSDADKPTKTNTVPPVAAAAAAGAQPVFYILDEQAQAGNSSAATPAVYPDWSGFQAYPPIPPHGFFQPGSQTHPYMWGPQPLMSPYGTPPSPYVMYPHGVYAHPSMQLKKGLPKYHSISSSSKEKKNSEINSSLLPPNRPPPLPPNRPAPPPLPMKRRGGSSQLASQQSRRSSQRIESSQSQKKDKQPMTASLRRKHANELQNTKKMTNVKESEKEHKSDEEMESSDNRSNVDGDNGSSEGDGSSNDGSSEGDESSEEEAEQPNKLAIMTSASKASALLTQNESLLKSFSTHIAYGIWDKQAERGPLKCISHWRKLQEWRLDDMPNEVVQKVKNSGLYNLIQHTYEHVDYVSISAFVERWHPETNSFHMPFGEMSITLDDVAQILKVPLVGSCLYKEKDDRTATDLLVEYLGVEESEAKEQTNDGNSVKLQFLLNGFSERANKEDANERDYEIVARAYLLYFLGCSIFCDKSGTKVAVHYLKCLENINHLGEQAWGMSVLAYLYRQLGLASRRNVRQMAGYLTLLTAWIYDHFPMLPNVVPSKSYNNTMPRMCRWQPMKQSGDPTSAIIRLREQLDDLTAQDVCWDPYRYVRAHYPLPDVAFYNGVILCFDIAEPYYPQRVVRQFGINQRIPSNPMEPKKCSKGLNANQYKVVYDNCFWYAENWEDHVLSSKSRLPLVIDPWDCTAKYMPWYLSVSHPTIQHPDMRQSSSRKVDAVDKLRLAATRAVEMLKKNLNSPPSKKVAQLLEVEQAAVNMLEEALNEPDKRAKRKKHGNDPKIL